ncbi:MAG TPA: phosphoribosyltransferase family protein [Candidatus Saccharimonadia bacterium]|jgi:predicted phosphoribosyltransferase|nr:phosphoribosyltransferase family protein [Candidatus Saccharimonadia bacterium]
MYFHDRAEAGDKLADELTAYRWENTAVLALSPGGVAVGEQIARRLHCALSLLLTSRISAPGDESLVIGTMDQTGGFTYNSMIPAGEMEEYMQDMRSYVEEQKLQQMYRMASVVGEHGQADPAQLEGRNVIIATDGVKNGLSFDAALNFLSRIRVEKTIAAIPVGPAEVIERIHSLVDETHYLYIPEAFFSVKHYYTDEPEIDPASVTERIDNVVARWI